MTKTFAAAFALLALAALAAPASAGCPQHSAQTDTSTSDKPAGT